MQVKAAQGNQSYKYLFEYNGDMVSSLSRTKWVSCDDAYIDCTWAENGGVYFNAWFNFWNEYDGTQQNNTSVQLWSGSQRWVNNGASAGDTTWFVGELVDDGFGGNYGAIAEGRWRPDASY